MSSNSFFPTTEAEQIGWLGNYASKLPLHGPACGILPEEINATLVDIQYYIWLLQYWHPAVQRDAREGTVYASTSRNTATMASGSRAASMAATGPFSPSTR